MANVDRQNFKTLSNRERAETYAEMKPHEAYYSETPVSRWIHEWRYNSMKNFMGDVSNKVLLDAGAGEGHFLSQINAKEKYGIEMSEKRVRTALKLFPNLKMIIGDIKNLPFEDNSLDVIVCSEVLEHVDEYQEAIHEFKRCLRSSGTLIVSFPNERMVGFGRLLIRKFPIHEIDHINWISPKDVKAVMSTKFLASNIPPLPYPFCLYQVYKFNASDLK